MFLTIVTVSASRVNTNYEYCLAFDNSEAEIVFEFFITRDADEDVDNIRSHLTGHN